MMSEIRANKTTGVIQNRPTPIGNGQTYDPKNYRFGCYNRGYLVGFPKREGNKIIVSRSATDTGSSSTFELDCAEGLKFDEIAGQTLLHEIIFQVSGEPDGAGGFVPKAVVTEIKPVDAHVIRKGNNIFDLFEIDDKSLRIRPREEMRQLQLSGLIRHIAAYNVVRFSGICVSIEIKTAAEVEGLDETGSKIEPFVELRLRQTSNSDEIIPVRLYGNVGAHQTVLERAVMRPFTVLGMLQFARNPILDNDGNPVLDGNGNKVIAKENFIRLRKMPQTPTATEIVWMAEGSNYAVPTWLYTLYSEHKARVEEKEAKIQKARAAARLSNPEDASDNADDGMNM